MNYLQIGNTKVEYELEFRDRKTIELVIDLNKGFKVIAPKGMSKVSILEHLKKKSKWIILNLDKMSDILIYNSNKEFISGEKFMLRGRRYKLKVRRLKSQELPELNFTKSTFEVKVPKLVSENDFHKLIRPLFLSFYKIQAQKTINKRVQKYQKYFKTKPSLVKVQLLKEKWGSCSSKNELRYNPRIIMSKMSVIDYVIVHEMCHMKHKNHSPAFWKEIKRILPEYEKSKEWLRIHGELLRI
jgi:predicted metal-dependent hydrolase